MLQFIKKVVSNFKLFVFMWGGIVLVNQIFIFGACFEPYCLLAALPHTAFLAAITTYLYARIVEDPKEKADKPIKFRDLK